MRDPFIRRNPTIIHPGGLKQLPARRFKLPDFKKLSILIIACLFLISLVLSTKHHSSTNSQTSTKPTPGLVLGLTSTLLPPLEGQKITLPPTQKPNATLPEIPAKSAILLDADSGYPLFSKNDQSIVPIASTTKIMTATIALEEYNLDQVATISEPSANIGGSRLGLYTGEKIKVSDLLYAMLMVSGNDAAYALADLQPNIKPGDFKPFVAKMNQKAQLLGLSDTKFFDPAGLDDNGHSTAHDLAYLTAYALRNKTFTQIVSTPSKTITAADGQTYPLTNSNRLVNPAEPLYFPSAIGVKTGNTDNAGHCLISAARQDNHLLVGVVLNTYYTYNDESARLSRLLLDWGFNSFLWPK